MQCTVCDKDGVDECARVPNSEQCAVCGKDESDGTLLMCDGCPASFHLSCIGMDAVPEDDQWFCDAPKCGGAKLCRISAEDRAAQQKASANLEQKVRHANAAASGARPEPRSRGPRRPFAVACACTR